MSKKKSLPGPISILMIVIALAAACTWLLPTGQYSKLTADETSFIVSSDSGSTTLPLTQQTLDSLGIHIKLEQFTAEKITKPISVPGTYRSQQKNGQGLLAILQAPIKGILDSIEIILFILIIGGFMYVFNETGAMVKGVAWLSHKMRGKEHWLIIILTALFSFFGGSFGMAEEAFVFYPILVPLFLAAGYDVLVPLAILFGGTTIGGMSSFSNPFATIIASNAAGIYWKDGLTERLIFWGIITGLFTWYILRYAAKVKANPSRSLVLKIDGDVSPPYEVTSTTSAAPVSLDWKSILLIFLYIASFIVMIWGVVYREWWTLEMSTIFLASSILMAIIARINEKVFIKEFIKGAETLLSVAFIVGVARGVTIVLNEGHISDSILYYCANMVEGLSPSIFILLLLLFYFGFSLFIQSSSGMAVLTMPIIGALAIMVNIPGREVVNSYMFGMSLMAFMTPTGLILPSLAMVNISLKTWFKFITPFLFVLALLAIIMLLIGVHL